ncbi:spectrin beta chain, non-erythrocytic 1-like isoform X1 [Stegodyphus dumicola]|uniref:spectrin beta chain, non-erythrocytic 1-like isoform X1 n=1 Tax=Stegodyphus dumicola TaxID=202533 RepID=UPI0015AC8EEF|nr:spectrin beta chain, non-erythrocytic 1-like isoform X1 [Stegodyphus dumicola]
MSQREDAIKFETGRIKALQEERLYIQKKTFTKWMNSFLQKARMEVEDLFTDLADGKKLLKLLEIISGEKLGKPNHGKMRVHKIENVNKSLAFLHTKVRLESIGAEDIVDGNPRLILGLIWTIILRFQIQEIEIDVNEDDESSEKKSAKDALLLWCQRKTAGYPGVNIQDFHVSWRNGLGFNALIHSHRPDLINYPALHNNSNIQNLNNAFDIAQKELGIPRLLDAEDVDTNKPDEKSVITYVASYYHTFARMKSEMKGGKRIANIVGQMIDADKLKNNYESFTTNLLEWIKIKIKELDNRNFPNSLEGIQKELLRFKEYRTIEKPPKYKERSEIEALLFSIQTKMKALGQPLYVPPEGQLVHDIEKAWDELEKAEHRREVALREELLRQEKLENLAYRFERKSVVREGYLKEMIQVLSDPRYGSNLSQVEATVKKHEAISADILAREERFQNLTTMADELVTENYHSKDRIKLREQEIMQRWHYLLELLKKHRSTLTNLSNLMSMLREIDTITVEIKDMESSFYTEDLGRHLLAVEDLLQKHSLVEAHITSQGDTIRKLNKQAQSYIDDGHKEAPILQKRLNKLNTEYDNLVNLAASRRTKLEESRTYYQFVQDQEEEEAWVIEKQLICKAVVPGRDLQGALSLQQKHKALEVEINARWPQITKVIEAGNVLKAQKHPESADVSARIDSLKKNWDKLHELWAMKCKQLEDACAAYQYQADANEAESWMKEKRQLMSSTDYGKDEPSAQALLQRHARLESEIKAYSSDIERLNEQAETMIKSGMATYFLSEAINEPESEEWVEEVVIAPVDEWVEEIYEKEIVKEVVEDRKIPQVRAMYKFSGQDLEIDKGEVMILLQKTNADWWNVRKSNGQDGFVPANYVTEIEPKIVRKRGQKVLKVPEKRKVKKTVMKKQIVKKKKQSLPYKKVLSRSPSKSQEFILKRQKAINESYAELNELSKARRHYLEDAIRLFSFYRECDDFEAWMKEKDRVLTTRDPKEGVEVMKKKFENFLTDLSATSRRIEEVDNRVEEFVRTKHSQLGAVRSRQKQIHDRWNRLNHLKTEIEKSLEGATSVELFERTCDDAYEWMLEKLEKIETDDIGRDMKTVQALQRKHQNLERELAPVEEKFNRVNLLADSVKASYPSERANVTSRQQELHDLWEKVKEKAAQRRARLDESLGLQIFRNSVKSLLAWVSDVKQLLNSDEPARDVATAENLLKKHQDLGDDIAAHQDEFTDIQGLGVSLLQKNPESTEIRDALVQLQEEQDAIHRGWQEKGDWLRQCMDLQVFNREADQIDSITNSHNAFLEFEDLGMTLDDVETLLKRHENFLNTLLAQDERLRTFSEMADKLIAARHYESKYIDQRRKTVLAQRQAVKQKAEQRKNLLLSSHAFQEFRTDVNELSGWIQEKLKTASDESYRDLTNLERKLQKHEAFEAELKANAERLDAINKNGESLLTGGHYAAKKIESLLKQLNEQWQELCAKTLEKGQKLREANAQHTYNRTLEDARTKLDELENSLASDDLGHDLRSVKKLLKRHQMLENELLTWETKVTELVFLGEEMASQGHFDAQNILKGTKSVTERFAKMKAPAAERRHILQESLKLHEFNFEVDTEIQWIKEHLPAASSQVLGQNLIDAQNIYKKHLKLEREINGHQPMIEKTLATGQQLIEQKHYASSSIESKCQELKTSWKELLDCASERKKKLELSLKAQAFFSEANEVEAWMNEKTDILESTDYGKDEDAAVKLLTKHKALELEIDTYCSLITEMGHQAQIMIDSNHPDSKVISNRLQVVNQQMKNIQKLANIRRQKLMESKHLHEYYRESDELENWVNEQMLMANSEDYGQDYEHLLLLQSKFDDFKLRVESGSERFNQCEELAKKLIASDSSYSGKIEQRQQHLRKAWSVLLDSIEARDQKLHAAGEIHRFNRDVADALSRIQEKYASIPDDLGRDLNSVQNLIRKHEGFENDLVALEAQLQILVDDSARLQGAYPGGNADHILEQQNIVIENWNTLQERAAQRKIELQASYQLQRFLSSVRDVENWALGLCSSLKTEEKVRDVASAQMLKAEHEQLKAEIEARESTFGTIVNVGEEMIEGGHYAQDEIRERLDQLLAVRGELHTAWHKKKIYLDQLCDLQCFLRDAKQLDTLSSQQEVYLSGSDMGNTVEEVDALVKKHEAFEKLLITQNEKLTALQEHGTKLLEQNHFDSDTIRTRMVEVTNRRTKVRDLSNVRRQKLADSFLHAQFKRDATEAEAWIEDKKKYLDAEQDMSQIASLEDKMRKLQKHQAFQAELSAHESNIQNIKQKGELLLSKNHENSTKIRLQLEKLLKQWNELLSSSTNLGRGLEEAQDILEFNNQAEKIEAWIRDKEMMVQAGDTGKDFEHCQALQRKLDDVDSDMRVDELRMKNINSLANKLIRQGRSDTQSVQQRQEELNKKWKALQGALELYREKLANASDVHAFNRDVDDTNDRINEKSLALHVEEETKDLQTVEACQRKLEATERDMTAIEAKLKEHEVDARRLIQKNPEAAPQMRQKISEVQENWRKLTNLCLSRKQSLSSAYTLHKFLSDFDELESWVNDISNRMTSGELATNNSEAQNMLQLHQERKAEINGRQEAFKGLKDFGHRLLQQNHSAKDLIESKLQRLEELRRNLTQVWEERRHMLTQCRDLQIFKEQIEAAESWLSAKEAFLNNEDLGDSMSSVEALVKKHDNFEKTMIAQSNKIDELETFATELIAAKHYDSTAIQSKCQDVCNRRDKLKETALIRRKKLQESKELQKFLRNIYEVVGWINEKIQVASDESYRDPTNLLSKIQKQAAFEAELAANKARVDAVMAEGEKLIGSGHFASYEIQNLLQELEMHWRQLLDQTALKNKRLQDAYQALQFNRMLDDLDTWIDEIEIQLQSEDHGKDLTAVQNLLKKHQHLETDINNHAENIEQVKDLNTSFQNSNHFLKEEIEEKAVAVVNRYQSLHDPVQIRRENLEDSLLLHQFNRDVEDELSWISEKEPLAASTDLGNNLVTVQNLQKKHQALEAEIHAHEPLIASVISKGKQMIRIGHFAAADVEAKLNQLQSSLQQLKDLSSIRKLRLLDAVESQTFYSEAAEAESWIQERKPPLISPDLGKDEDSVQSLMKKLDGLERDIHNFNNNIIKLAKLSQGLIERGHFDSENIQKKQKEVESSYLELKNLAEERGYRLQESKRFFNFMRDADEVAAWIQDQMIIASSEDYGKDVEHVEILIQKFEGFLNTLHSNEDRVANLENSATTLLKENHPESQKIMARNAEIAHMWEELKECAQSRQEALAGAKQVHTFDRSADETISWIHEKDTVLSSEDFGHDLETIQALVRRHEGFERDLAAVKEQVVALVEEARRLASQFPDAKDHIDAKHEDVAEAWNQLLEKSAERKDKLQQAEKLQAYFDDYRELMAWLSEMMALITSHELARDVSGAEALLARHKEYKSEVDTRLENFNKFYETGETIIASGHFMAEEIKDRIHRLKAAFAQLQTTWEKRQIIYEQNLDSQIFKRDAETLEAWLQSREPILFDKQYGDSISAVEELIRKHEDFEKTIEAQEEKFLALKRITKLEEAFARQKEEEERNRKAEVQRKEQERLDAIKRKEQKRILEERRREDERRRTQEIVLKKPGEEYEIDGNEISPLSSPKNIPEIRHPPGLFRASSQKSLDGDKLSVKRGESMRVEGLSPWKPESPAHMKRSESMRLDERQKKPKRTPSFTTRRRTQSFRRQRTPADLPPVEIEGFLDRKQELQSGGKRATIRSWKTYYTVVCGQLLCFFKDKEAFVDNNAAAPPVSLLQAKCSKAADYTKKKHVFRLQLVDGAEFLFMAHNEKIMYDWMNKIAFHAALPPSMQLMRYETRKSNSSDSVNSSQKASVVSEDSTAGAHVNDNHETTSATSSQGSTPELRRAIMSHTSNQVVTDRSSLSRSHPPPYEEALLREKQKPPIPPRNLPSRPLSDPPSRLNSQESSVSVKSRIEMFQSQQHAAPPAVAPRSSFPGVHHHNGTAISTNRNSIHTTREFHRSIEENSSSYSDNDHSSLSVNSAPPPLPQKPPPAALRSHNVPDSDDDWHPMSDGEMDKHAVYRRQELKGQNSDFTQYRQTYETTETSHARHMSLPHKVQPIPGTQVRPFSTLEVRSRTTSSEGSSEGEVVPTDRKIKEKKKGGMFGFLKKK